MPRARESCLPLSLCWGSVGALGGAERGTVRAGPGTGAEGPRGWGPSPAPRKPGLGRSERCGRQGHGRPMLKSVRNSCLVTSIIKCINEAIITP